MYNTIYPKPLSQISDAISLSIFLKCFLTFGKDTPWIKTKQNIVGDTSHSQLDNLSEKA